LDDNGATDYLAAALRVADTRRQPGMISFSCTRPGGFTDEMAQRCLASLSLLASLIDTHVSEIIAASLLDVYLGHDAGQRVLQGAVKRGDGETIPAVICFADLRNFTTLSDQLPREQLLALLDTYFACVVGAVHEQGGEVLKFIGDAVLAIFRVSPGEEAAACAAAIAAAHGAQTAVATASAERAAAGLSSIDFGLALHLGEVMYGNIGGPDRLDFTVLGPAVNVASRIEGLCGRLGQSLLVSDAVARHAGGVFLDLGEHALKGVSVPIRLWAPGSGPR
ncbi:MAG: adenylate/guanylate cyclase domain-containing protein, partial [Myxococcota bacterium]